MSSVVEIAVAVLPRARLWKAAAGPARVAETLMVGNARAPLRSPTTAPRDSVTTWARP